MKAALVHDWLTGMRGGEKVLESLCRLFPAADLFTLLHLPGTVSALIESRRITTSFLQKLPQAGKRYRHYLPLMPLAVETFDLSGYDLVISSSHCVAKSVRHPPTVPHISYCHTPMRYVWDQYDVYFGPGRAAWPVRTTMAALRKPLQRWDASTSRRVDAFVANSAYIADRIRRHYGREAEVIHPPVEAADFPLSRRDDGYYLLVSALVPYKRADVAVEAFNRLEMPLRIVGSGPEERDLRRRAGRTIEFAGWAGTEELRAHYAGCRALVFPAEEDFGIVPVEAMASGKPVIAYGRGGARETVVPLGSAAPTGLFFDAQAPESLAEAVRTFEANRGRFDPVLIRERALLFDRPRFEEKIRSYVRKTFERLAGRPWA